MTPVEAKKLEKRINQLEKLVILHIQQTDDDLNLTATQKKALARAERDYKAGTYTSTVGYI